MRSHNGVGLPFDGEPQPITSASTAQAGNLIERSVEVRRQPVTGRYADIARVDARRPLSPAAFTSATIEVAASLG
jgi:hypothetical protein